MFKSGTYWVYENNLGEVDSQYIYLHNHYYQVETYPKIVGEKDLCDIRYSESYDMQLLDSTPQKLYDNIIMSVASKGLFINRYNFDGSSIATGLYGVTGQGFYQPNIQYYDSILIKNQVFYAVERFTQRADVLRPYYDDVEYITDFFFCPYTGIVRKVEYRSATDTVVWDLSRYQINNY